MTNQITNKHTTELLVRYDYIRLLYAGMLLHFTSDEIRRFWNSYRLPGYSSTDEYMMFTELWQGSKWYSQKYVFSLLSHFENFLQTTNVDIQTFIRSSFGSLNKGILIPPRDWLSWSKSILGLFFSGQDPRFLVLQLVDHYNSHFTQGLKYSIPRHSIDGNKRFRTVLMVAHTDPSIEDRPLKHFDAELWAAIIIKRFPTAIQLPEYESYTIIADYRDISDIVPEATIIKNHLYLNDKKIATQHSFSQYCRENNIDIKGLHLEKKTSWLVLDDYYCPLRKRIVLHKGCIINAPVSAFEYHYSATVHTPLNFLEPLIDDISKFSDNVWSDIKVLHKKFISELHPKIFFKYDRKNETVMINGEPLIKNVPAKILRKMLMIYTETGRTRFYHSEFVKDESIIGNPYNPNFVVRLQRLTQTLKAHEKGISIVKADKGVFELVSQYKIEFSECN
ncbi:MAG: hypothetical protein GX639_14315 [Fibrobacter sp.]|nr:hypothetical protein [Fibrobacter sp.]